MHKSAGAVAKKIWAYGPTTDLRLVLLQLGVNVGKWGGKEMYRLGTHASFFNLQPSISLFLVSNWYITVLEY